VKAFKKYKTYSFTGQDPVVEKVREAMGNHSAGEVSRRSGVSAGTVGKWLTKKTKRPQYATIAAVVNALGHRIVIARRKER
jgi:hypothetical protein